MKETQEGCLSFEIQVFQNLKVLKNLLRLSKKFF